MRELRRSLHTALRASLLGLGIMASAGGQEPSRPPPPSRDYRRDYAAFLKLPAADREQIKKIVGELKEEEPEAQARLLQVMQRYLTWLDRLPPADRRWIEEASSSAERIERIRELRERQWVASLTRAERDRLENVSRRKDGLQAGQAVLWSTGRAFSLALTAGAPCFPLPLLDERQRLIAGFRQRERQMELERQLALAQGPERQQAVQQELQRLRKALLEKPLTAEERRQVNASPEDLLSYVRTVFDLARKYNVPLPEPKRRPVLSPGLPRLPPDKLITFVGEHFSEAVQRDYEERLKDREKRPQAVAELTALYWNTHPQELREHREQERKKRMKEGVEAKKK